MAKPIVTPDQYRQDIWDSFPHLRKPEPQFDTPETRAAFRTIWEQISGAGEVCDGR